jgi:hypothetical protein
MHFALQDEPAAALTPLPANPTPLWQGLAACLIPSLIMSGLVWRVISLTP